MANNSLITHAESPHSTSQENLRSCEIAELQRRHGAGFHYAICFPFFIAGFTIFGVAPIINFG